MPARELGLFFPLLAMLSSGNYAAAPPCARQLQDIKYEVVDGVSLRMDGALPASARATPAVIIVHGGGWVRGDRRIDVQPLFKPLENAGFAWFSISYRLAADVTQLGVAIDDVQEAVRFVKAHAAEYNVDPNRIALVGESAGGQLAAMAALRANADSSVMAVVAFYTPTDLAGLFEDSTLIPAKFRDRVKGTPWEGLVRAGLSQLSPVAQVRRDMPPFLFIHGTADPLVPFVQSTQMCERMKQVGASCEVYRVEGAGHGLRWWESSARSSGAYKHKMVQWLKKNV